MKLDFTYVFNEFIEAKGTGFSQSRFIEKIYEFIGSFNSQYEVAGPSVVHSNKLKKGKEAIRRPIVKGAQDPKVIAAFPAFCKEYLLTKVKADKLRSLVDNLLIAVRSDSSIGVTDKERMERYARNREETHKFLSEVLLYTLQTNEPMKSRKPTPITEEMRPLSRYIDRKLAIVNTNCESVEDNISEREILEHASRVSCIVGEGGLGKSLLMEHIHYLHQDTCHRTACAPCVGGLVKGGLVDLIPQNAEILLLDGFDELVSEKDALLEHVLLLMSCKTNMRIIFTVRSEVDIKAISSRLGTVTRFQLLPFSDDDCIALATEILGEENVGDFLNRLGIPNHDGLQLSEHKELDIPVEFSHNPYYLCKMIRCYLETGSVPRDRVNLLDYALDYTCLREKQLTAFSLNKEEILFSREHIYGVLKKYAFLRFSCSSEIPSESILKWVFSEYSQVSDPDFCAKRFHAYLTAREVFEHQLMLEYLTALYFWDEEIDKTYEISNSSIEKIFAYCDTPHYWQTVIQLLLEIIDDRAWEQRKKDIHSAIINLGHMYVFRNSHIRSIYIPGTLEEISSYFLADCRQLEQLHIDEGVKEISVTAFNGCCRLEELRIPQSVVSLFYTHPCSGGEEQDIPNLRRIYLPRHLSYRIPNDERVVVYGPDPTTMSDTHYIAAHAFRGQEITAYQIPDGVISVDQYAFADCKNLTDVCIPDSVVELGNNVFDGCWSLTTVEIPNSVVRIGKEAFRDCLALKEVHLPKGLKHIEKNMFSTTSITHIDIPDSVVDIGDFAFAYCDNLTNVCFPKSLADIGRMVFHCCYNLTQADFSRCTALHTIPAYIFSGCANLRTVLLPEGVVEIDKNAFADTKLSEIVLPRSVNVIGSKAFADCELKSIKLPRKFSGQITEIFGDIDDHIIQYYD